MKQLAIILVILLLTSACMLIAGCTTNAPVQPQTTVTTTPASPQISILSPQSGAVIPSGNVPVTIQVSNFNIVDKQGQTKVAGEGHVHFYLDVSPVPSDPAKPAIPADAKAAWAHVSGTSYTFTNVSPGMHTVTVQLANNDHTPVIPLATQSVMFTTSGTVPTAVATTSAGASGGGQTVTTSLIAKNIAFDQSTITVPAGAHVVMSFDNQDSGVVHNFALYTDSSASKKIFVGDFVTGPKKVTYTFDAPATPGNYFFRCDIHPTTMIGKFVVT